MKVALSLWVVVPHWLSNRRIFNPLGYCTFLILIQKVRSTCYRQNFNKISHLFIHLHLIRANFMSRWALPLLISLPIFNCNENNTLDIFVNVEATVNKVGRIIWRENLIKILSMTGWPFFLNLRYIFINVEARVNKVSFVLH